MESKNEHQKKFIMIIKISKSKRRCRKTIGNKSIFIKHEIKKIMKINKMNIINLL